MNTLSFNFQKIKYLLSGLLFNLPIVVNAAPPSVPGFIPNKGQWDAQVLYKMQQSGTSIFVGNGCMTYLLSEAPDALKNHGTSHHHVHEASPYIKQHAVRMQFENALAPNVEAEEANATHYNYFLGNDSKKWVGGLLSYRTLRQNNLYEGIDLVIHTQREGIKYDLIVGANANPKDIVWSYKGADAVNIQNGVLYIKTSLGLISEQKPYAYQIIDGVKKEVSCNYSLSNGVVSFELGKYRKDLELIIDPQIIFATYSGSFSDNWGFTSAYDNAGKGYSGGVVFGSNFPAQLGAFQSVYGGGQLDIGILKYSADATTAEYITFLGGNDMELPHSFIVNEFDELLVFGTTGSPDFPVSSGAYQTSFLGGTPATFENGFISIANGLDIFVARFSTDGASLLASTYAGGTGNDGMNSAAETVANYADEIRGSIWVDSNNDIYVGTSTQSTDIPTGDNAYQTQYGGGSQDGIILKFDGNLNELLWASYLGGSGSEGIFYLTVNELKQVVVTGGTSSSDFPITANAFQTSYQGNTDGFVALLDSTGSSLDASSFLGTVPYDQSYIVGTDGENNVYVFGQTSATGNEFIENSPIAVSGGNQFITKFEPDLSNRIWSTTFGNATGQPDISPTALLVDVCDKIYITGWGGVINPFGTTTTGLPVTADAFQSSTDGNDFYLYVIDNQAQSVVYASFLGGSSSLDHVDGGTSRFDRKGVIYQSICAGCGGQSDLPVTAGAFSPTNNSTNCNNALVKFDFESPITVSAFVNTEDPVGCAPYTVTFDNTSVNADIFTWSLGSQVIGSSEDLTYTFNTPGEYEVTLVASSKETCNISDTVRVSISVLADIAANVSNVSGCAGEVLTLGPENLSDPYYTFSWTPSIGLSDATVSNPQVTVSDTVNYQLIVSIGACIDTVEQIVTPIGGSRQRLDSLSICLFDTVQIDIGQQYGPNAQYVWTPSNQVSNPQIENPFFYGLSPADLNLVVTLPSGCADTFDVRINTTTVSFTPGNNPLVCAGQPVEIGTVDSSGLYSYQWQPEGPLSDANLPNPTATVADTTLFTVIRVPVGNTEECPAEGTLNVWVVPAPEAGFGVNISTACDGVSVSITDSSAGYTELLWEISKGIELQQGIFQFEFPYSDSLSVVQIASLGNCRDTASFATYIEALEDYYKENNTNVFTPNNDGLNDCFSPALQLQAGLVITDYLPCSALIVFDRWGRKVFDSTFGAPSSCWDGNGPDGGPMNEGVYFYEYQFNETRKTGWVHLKR